MTTAEWTAFSSAFLAEMASTLTAKAADYNRDDDDRFDNVKAIAALAKQDPLQTAFTLAAKHITAIANHCAGQLCTTEAVRGRLIDLANYCVIIAALEEDRQHAYTRTEEVGERAAAAGWINGDGHRSPDRPGAGAPIIHGTT